MKSDILGRVNTLLADGEILFVCNRSDTEMWMQAHAFYDYGGCLYAVTKDFAGIFHKYPNQPSDPFIQCRAYHLSNEGVIVNLKGNVIAARKNYVWTLLPPGTMLEEFLLQERSNPEVDESRNEGGNDDHRNDFKPSSRFPANFLYQWFRRIFPKKSPAVGGYGSVP
jgi:hypothetical protein